MMTQAHEYAVAAADRSGIKPCTPPFGLLKQNRKHRLRHISGGMAIMHWSHSRQAWGGVEWESPRSIAARGYTYDSVVLTPAEVIARTIAKTIAEQAAEIARLRAELANVKPGPVVSVHFTDPSVWRGATMENRDLSSATESAPTPTRPY